MTHIDSNTFQPARFGEIYNDRTLTLFGEARWNLAGNQIIAQNLRIVSAPISGGSSAVNTLNGTFTLSASGASLWVRIKRTGSNTILALDTFEEPPGSHPRPSQDLICLFVREGDEVVALNGFFIPNSLRFTKLGLAKTPDYDWVVAPLGGDPRADFFGYSGIQAAINTAADGDSILILSGTYSGSTAQGGDSAAAYSWSGKTLYITGEGYSTVIQNTGALTRVFRIGCTATSGMQGNGTKITNIRFADFPQSVRFDANTFGIRNCEIDVWQTHSTTFTAPDIIGTGTRENNRLSLHTQIGSTFRQYHYNLSDSPEGTGTVYQTRLRLGNASGESRLKLPVYTSAARLAATSSAEAGEVFWDSDKETLEVRTGGGTTFASFAPLPLGSIIPMTGFFDGGDNTVAYTEATGFSGVTIPANYRICDGNQIVESRSPFNGKYAPRLNDERFLQGNTSGGLGQSFNAPVSTAYNYVNIAHNHTYTVPNHDHPMPHSHPLSGLTIGNFPTAPSPTPGTSPTIWKTDPNTLPGQSSTAYILPEFLPSPSGPYPTTTTAPGGDHHHDHPHFHASSLTIERGIYDSPGGPYPANQRLTYVSHSPSGPFVTIPTPARADSVVTGASVPLTDGGNVLNHVERALFFTGGVFTSPSPNAGGPQSTGPALPATTHSHVHNHRHEFLHQHVIPAHTHSVSGGTIGNTTIPTTGGPSAPASATPTSGIAGGFVPFPAPSLPLPLATLPQPPSVYPHPAPAFPPSPGPAFPGEVLDRRPKFLSVRFFVRIF